jgi:phosphoribosylformylglycinamidine synthase
MSKVRVIVVAGNGINCELETQAAFRLAGASCVDIVYLWDLFEGEKDLLQYQILCFPGGFLDGDDLGAAKATCNRINFARIKGKNRSLFDEIQRFFSKGGLILGICNGFQLLVKLGLIPNLNKTFTQEVTLTFNDSGRFETRWVDLKVDTGSKCIFTKGIEYIYLPVRHGEGKFVPKDESIQRMIKERGLIPLYYSDSNGFPTMNYPDNPNGSIGAVAGLCDETGRIFGLMPHPEVYLHRTNHPRWTRERLPEKGMGLLLFENAVRYFT